MVSRFETQEKTPSTNLGVQFLIAKVVFTEVVQIPATYRD